MDYSKRNFLPFAAARSLPPDEDFPAHEALRGRLEQAVAFGRELAGVHAPRLVRAEEVVHRNGIVVRISDVDVAAGGLHLAPEAVVGRKALHHVA